MGNYDVVHIAIFALVVKNNDPGPLLRNLVRMLSECIPVLFSFGKEILRALMTDHEMIHQGVGRLIMWIEPGGYLRWNELDVASRRIIKADPMASAEKLTVLVEFAGVWEDKLGPKE